MALGPLVIGQSWTKTRRPTPIRLAAGAAPSRYCAWVAARPDRYGVGGNGRWAVARARQQERLEAVRARVRAGGRRWTVAKGAIVETLIGHRGHLSVQEVHDEVTARFPQIDRSTVHRVLLTLSDEHVVHVLGRQGEARYGMADHPHHHAVCSRCGHEAEIPAAVVAPALAAAGEVTGFRFGSITLTGTCPDCA